MAPRLVDTLVISFKEQTLVADDFNFIFELYFLVLDALSQDFSATSSPTTNFVVARDMLFPLGVKRFSENGIIVPFFTSLKGILKRKERAVKQMPKQQCLDLRQVAPNLFDGNHY